ncbi:MAG: hypothetical protein COB04_07880 [Gammaproteobacteria bacterium]|nr:MAG: hypothetical protein COB04_07880 [Gammaproteobacteria bacterium]
MQYALKLALIVLVASFTFACSTTPTYTPPAKDASNVAVIKGGAAWFTLAPMAIRIKSVDGLSVSAWKGSVSVSPGDHVIGVVCQSELNQRRYLSHSRLSLFALPGKTYYLESRNLGDQCTVSMVEG